MTKITGWRAGTDTGNTGVDAFIERIREKSIDAYGRPDVPQLVQLAAEILSVQEKTSKRDALDKLIFRAGSFETLCTQLSEENRKKSKKKAKAAKEKAELNKKPKTATGQFQRAVDVSKKFKRISVVLGGAPGLGKKA
ncbi:MAG: hypothetical protein HYX42_10910 [Polaromonas sp.]|uniref:hypothetical protein n=1 Tax=Polaromonas sp. TaxID=1869339 RepID=UPI0025EADBC9|nr:hypothetical protein [Polaromonas sp.]MBI2726747.1 hypothetical protein [Polaromonas sp.]